MTKVEYLLELNTKSDSLCKDEKSFNALLKLNSDISITKTKLKYKNKSYTYALSVHTPKDDCIVFSLSLSSEKSKNEFSKMLKAIMETLATYFNGKILPVWDDISFERSKELYSRIYQVENYMRNLICKFMYINVGGDWNKIAIPQDVKNSRKSKTEKEDKKTDRNIIKKDMLYDIDFIQLSKLLFKEYSHRNISEINEILGNNNEDVKQDNLKDFIPENNWDRYFSEIVDCDSRQLENKWGALYIIRNKVAHNVIFDEGDLRRGIDLCNELDDILKKAISKLDDISVPKEEIDDVSANTMETLKNYDPLASWLETMEKMQIHDPLASWRETMEKMQIHDPLASWREHASKMQINMMPLTSFNEKERQRKENKDQDTE